MRAAPSCVGIALSEQTWIKNHLGCQPAADVAAAATDVAAAAAAAVGAAGAAGAIAVLCSMYTA